MKTILVTDLKIAENINLSVRSINILRGELLIDTLEDLMNLSVDGVLTKQSLLKNMPAGQRKVPIFGKVVLKELNTCLDFYRKKSEEKLLAKTVATFTDEEGNTLDLDINFATNLQLNNIIWIDPATCTPESHPYFLNTTTEELEKWDGWWIVTRKLFRAGGKMTSKSNVSVLEIEVTEMHENGEIQERFKNF